MKYLKVFQIAIVSLFVFSCANEVNQQIENIAVDVKCPVVYPLVNLMEIEQVLELETVDDALFSYITRIAFRKDRIYVYAEEGLVRVFNNSGQFIRNIGKKGRGPYELNFSFDFDVSPDGKEIAIWDYVSSKLLIYNLEGEVLRRLVAKEIGHAFQFCWLEKGSFLLSSLYRPQSKVAGSGEYQAYLLDDSLRVVRGLIPYDKKYEGLRCTGTVFQKYDNGSVYYRHPIEGDLYEIDNKGEHLTKRFTFGQYTLKSDRKAQYAKDIYLLAKDDRQASHAILHELWELKNFYYGFYGYDGKTYSVVIDKLTGQQRRYRHSLSFDFLSGIRVIGVANDRLVASVEPYKIKEKLAKLNSTDRVKYQDEVKYWESLVKDKSDTDNPILVFLKPKDF